MYVKNVQSFRPPPFPSSLFFALHTYHHTINQDYAILQRRLGRLTDANDTLVVDPADISDEIVPRGICTEEHTQPGENYQLKKSTSHPKDGSKLEWSVVRLSDRCEMMRGARCYVGRDVDTRSDGRNWQLCNDFNTNVKAKFEYAYISKQQSTQICKQVASRKGDRKVAWHNCALRSIRSALLED